MKAFSLVFVLLALAQWCTAYSSYQRPSGYSSGYTSASSYATSSASSSSSGSTASATAGCCFLNSWAYGHMVEVRQFANRLREEFNQMSQGSTTSYTTNYGTQWNSHIIELTGKTAIELDSLIRQISEQLVTDMRKGLLSYHTIAQSNFFEWKAAELLKSYAETANLFGQEQQQTLDIGHYQPVDLSNFDEVQNYAFPAEVKVIDGKTYVVHKNCTEATKSVAEGFTTNTSPMYPTGIHGGSNILTTNSMITAGRNVYVPTGSSSTTTITRKNTIRDWVNSLEPGVMDYKPVISVNGQSSYSNADVETFNTGSPIYRPSYVPGSVTVTRYNKTIYSNSDGVVHGSEATQKWVDGKLVYDTNRPFGEWTVPRDDAWKREERERFFWFLSQGTASPQRLEAWQRQHEERLLAMADRYHTNIEVIQDFHRKELERYRVLLGQYQAQVNDMSAWQRMERGRLDWLIHQNSVTREELERWQRENQDKLAQLARQYRISLEELKNWQVTELNRLYVYFNDVNNSMITRPSPGSDSLVVNSEQERLEELIRQHNATISSLQSSIKLDQQKLTDLSQKYRGNVKDMEAWLKSELARISGIIKEQGNEMTRITAWQSSERSRLENILKQHQGSVGDLETQMAHDRNYIRSLAAKYHVSIEELEKWQRAELERLHNEGQTQLDMNIKEWQRNEREHLKSIINKNDLTIDEFQTKIMSDRARLEQLARTYKIQVTEVEDWIKKEIKNFQSEGLLKEVEKELALWQQKERDRLLSIVNQNHITVEELEKKIKGDQSHLYSMANTYQVRVEEIEEWLKKELLRLQSQGLIKEEELKDWQRNERNEILKIVQLNKLTIDEFENKLLTDRQRLMDLSKTYNVQVSEIETWIKNEGERLQNLGLLKMQEQLNNWQKIERERLMALVNKNNLSIEEIEERIKKDQVHLYSLAHQHQVRVEEIEEWIKEQIKKLKAEGLIEMSKLKDWQTEWRGNLTNMVQERDFTVEEFHKWLLEDRARLQSLAMQHNVQIEEIEQWVKREEQRFVSLGLLKPNEKLTNWQEVERLHLENLTQQQYKSTEQLEARLRQDRELLEKLARDYSVQVEEIEQWMKKELARLRDDGQLQIDNLTSWQLAERERLEQLVKQNKQWSVEELEAVLRKDREHMQTMAFQYHTSVEEIEKWIQSEVARLQQQGKIDIEKLTNWQKAEQQRILSLLQQQTSITLEEFETKVQKDRTFLMNLANQYHVSVIEVEEYVKKVIEDLRKKGQFEVENLQNWQVVERDYIKQLISQYSNQPLSTTDYEQKLLSDRVHLTQLADQYRISVEQIEKWMIDELKRLRGNSEQHIQKLTIWQAAEAERLKNLIKQHNHLTFVEYEIELMKERTRLENLAKQYSVNVQEIEKWLRQQLVNLKSTGEIQVENLTQWQTGEQQRLIKLLMEEQNNVDIEEFEKRLVDDRYRVQRLSQQYQVSVEQIEQWMRDELTRLKNSGLVQMDQLTFWQKIERDRLQDWLKQQHNGATYEEFVTFLKRDKERLNRIAQEYHITVEEVESWVQKEGARLQLIGIVQRPENNVTIEEFYNIWDSSNKHNGNIIYNNQDDEIWKQQTFAHLRGKALVKAMSWEEFERYLKEERKRWEDFARQYNITVEEIEVWLRQSAQNLGQQGLISGSITIEEWEAQEQSYIQDLIQQKLRKQQKWSIEELERLLINDREHMQKLAAEYHITVDKIEQWYKHQLQNLLNQRKLISEHLVDWQRREKERIYWIVKQQPGMSLQTLEEQLLQDRQTLKRLADEYRVTVEELEYWTRDEIKRLVNLGLISDLSTSTNYNQWQQQERQRLRTIAVDITITEEELLEFIAADNSYQQQLARIYGCRLDKLAPFQRIEIGVMQREHLLDNIQLLNVKQWQRRERDRLFVLIKNQNFNMKNLNDWQRQDMYLNELAAKYAITVQELKDWQINEFERLEQLAKHYQMSLYQLQDFRDKELRYLSYVMHKKMSTERERANWAANEAKRMQALERKSGLNGEELVQWRRKLYLLCQGRLPMDFGGYGGHDLGKGSTNVTAVPQQIISKDRGDQPPHIYDENLDADEPGVEGEYRPTSSAPIIMEPSRYPYYLPPSTPMPARGGVQGGYRYSKKEYQFTVPVGDAKAAASVDSDGSSASASAGFNGMQSHALTRDTDNGQQQQQEEVDDFGQQQQEDLGWNSGRYTSGHQAELDQQVQVEDLSGYDGSRGRYTSGHQHQTDLGQQVQVEDLSGSYTGADRGQQQQIIEVDGVFPQQQHGASQKQVRDAEIISDVEVKAEPEPSGFWGKLKQKTTNLLG